MGCLYLYLYLDDNCVIMDCYNEVAVIMMLLGRWCYMV